MDLRPSKHQNSVIFQDLSRPEVLYMYTTDRVLSHVFRFLKIQKFSLFFMKLPYSSLIETFILYLLLKINRFYLLNCLRDSVSRKPFCLEPRKHEVTLTSFMADVSMLASFPFVRMCPVDGSEGIENLTMVRQ